MKKHIIYSLIATLAVLSVCAQEPTKRAKVFHTMAYDSLRNDLKTLFSASKTEDAREVSSFLEKHSVAGVPTPLALYPVQPAKVATDVLVVPILSDPALGDDRSIVKHWSWTNIQHVPDGVYLAEERAILIAFPFSANVFWNTTPLFLAGFHARCNFYNKYSLTEQMEEEVKKQELFDQIVSEHFGPAYVQAFSFNVEKMKAEAVRRKKNVSVSFADSTYVLPLLVFGGKCISSAEQKYRTELLYRSACFSIIEKTLPPKEQKKRKIEYMKARYKYLGYL